MGRDQFWPNTVLDMEGQTTESKKFSFFAEKYLKRAKRGLLPKEWNVGKNVGENLTI